MNTKLSCLIGITVILICACRTPEEPVPAAPAPTLPERHAPEPGEIKLTIEDSSLTEDHESALSLILDLSLKEPERHEEISQLTLMLPGQDQPLLIPENLIQQMWDPSGKAFRTELPLPVNQITLGAVSARIDAHQAIPAFWEGTLKGRGFTEGTLYPVTRDDEGIVMLRPPFETDAASQSGMLMVYFDTNDTTITHMQFFLYDSSKQELARSPLYPALKPKGTNSYLMDPLDFPTLPGLRNVAYLRIVPHAITRTDEESLTTCYRLLSPLVRVH